MTDGQEHAAGLDLAIGPSAVLFSRHSVIPSVSLPTTSSTTVCQTISIFSFSSARCCMIFEARI